MHDPHLGARIFASEAEFYPARSIVLSEPQQNDSTKSAGRFGTEVAWVRPYIDTEPGQHYLVLFDEIGSGTSERGVAPFAFGVFEAL